MRRKILLGLGSIAAMLLISSIISVMEYRRMSNYVTDLIAENIKTIDFTQRLAILCEEHNLKVLSAIGEEGVEAENIPFDDQGFRAYCDSIRVSLATHNAAELTDSVIVAYERYMEVSEDMVDVIPSEFIDSRGWFFGTLQPCYEQLREDIVAITDAAYQDLHNNSVTFQDGFYRAIIPGMVAVGAGLLLVLLLSFYLLAYYINPLYKMLKHIKASAASGTKYNCRFDGTDQIAELNEQITDLLDEHVELRRRIRILKDEREKLIETVQGIEE